MIFFNYPSKINECCQSQLALHVATKCNVNCDWINVPGEYVFLNLNCQVTLLMNTPYLAVQLPYPGAPAGVLQIFNNNNFEHVVCNLWKERSRPRHII